MIPTPEALGAEIARLRREGYQDAADMMEGMAKRCEHAGDAAGDLLDLLRESDDRVRALTARAETAESALTAERQVHVERLDALGAEIEALRADLNVADGALTAEREAQQRAEAALRRMCCREECLNPSNCTAENLMCAALAPKRPHD